MPDCDFCDYSAGYTVTGPLSGTYRVCERHIFEGVDHVHNNENVPASVAWAREV